MTRVQEIPFKSLVQNRLVPWIVALMCYLAVLALGLSTYLNDAINRFHHTLEKATTVELSLKHQGFKTLRAQQNRRERQEKLLHVLEQYSRTGRVELLGTSPLEAFAMPWKAERRDPLFEPPLLVDVFPKPGQHIDPKALTSYVSHFFPGAQVYKLHPWKQHLKDLAWRLLLTALATAGLVSFVALSIIFFTTYTSLHLHQRTIGILRLIGASNRFIVKRFQTYATFLAFKGGFLGAILAFLTFVLLLGWGFMQENLALVVTLFAAPCVLTLLTLMIIKASFALILVNERL